VIDTDSECERRSNGDGTHIEPAENAMQSQVATTKPGGKLRRSERKRYQTSKRMRDQEPTEGVKAIPVRGVRMEYETFVLIENEECHHTKHRKEYSLGVPPSEGCLGDGSPVRQHHNSESRPDGVRV
jgi:hypothetical protein